MPRASLIQTDFTGGELSPRLEGRVDIAKYFKGVKTLKNMTVFPHGGATRRGGTKFIAEIKDSDVKTRLLPFEFSVTQGYVLEFGNTYFRIFTAQGQVINGGNVVEVVTPYLEAELFELQFAQSADQLFMAHPNHEPVVISRLSNTSWTANEITFIDGPYLDQNVETTTLTPSAASGTVTIQASSTVGINGGQGFLTTDVGRFVRINETPNSGYAKITGRTNSTFVTATVIKAFGSTNARTTWRLGAWSNTTGFPRSVTFHESRLVWGGSNSEPQKMWGSGVGDFFSHIPTADVGTLTAADAWAYAIGTNQVNVIRWMNSGKALLVGTAGGEFAGTGSTRDAPITPLDVKFVRQSNHGSAYILPVRVNNQVLFIQRNGRKLRQLIWDFDQDEFVAPDLTLLSEHITMSSMTQIDYQQDPDSIIWAVLTDGTLVGLTYQLDQEVFAWHRHIIGGQSDAGGTQAKVESVAVINSTIFEGRDEVWVIVNRLINGVTKRYVELIMPGLEETDRIEESFFVDSGLSLDDPKTITGATQTDPVVITANGHGFENGDKPRLTEIIGMTELNNRTLEIANKQTNTFELLGIDGTGFTAYIQGGKARKSTSLISRLDHLEGETVAILGDGAVQPSKAVASGAITLSRPASHIHIGIGGSADVGSMNLEGGALDGTSQGKIKRISRITYRLRRTVGLKHGPDEDHLDSISFGPGTSPMNEPNPLFTGDKTEQFKEGYSREGTYFLRQDQPLPLTILAVMPIMKSNN
jgi:hypothetical protein